MGGVVGSGDEAEEEEDEVGHPKDARELLVQDLLSVGHLLLRVPPESVPSDDLLQQGQKEGMEREMKSHKFSLNASTPAPVHRCKSVCNAQSRKPPNCPSTGQTNWHSHALDTHSAVETNY